jgi:hypothetical protein
MTLLYDAALKTNPENDRPPAINPTAGVLPRPALGKAIWVADASKPYGGIWVAQDNEEKADSGLTENSVVLQRNMGQDRPPPELESTDPTVRVRAMGSLRGSDEAARVTGSVGWNGKHGEYSPGQDSATGSYGVEVSRSNSGHTAQQTNGMDLLGQSIHIDQQQKQRSMHRGQAEPTRPHDTMQVFREMQMSGSNVNPQLNLGGIDLSGGSSALHNGWNPDVSPSLSAECQLCG